MGNSPHALRGSANDSQDRPSATCIGCCSSSASWPVSIPKRASATRSGKTLGKEISMKIRFALCAVLGLLSLPVIAQNAPFEAEIDCSGGFDPPAQVPFRLRFENQTQRAISLDVTVRVTVAGLATFTLREASIRLGADQDRDIEQVLNLRADAPRGDYTMSLIAT